MNEAGIGADGIAEAVRELALGFRPGNPAGNLKKRRPVPGMRAPLFYRDERSQVDYWHMLHEQFVKGKTPF